MAHTPGPWTVEGTVALGAYGVWAGPWQICSVLTESFLTTDGPRNRSERDANAKLIAAAPDLLAFAKAHEAWEAEFILDSECWPLNESGLPVFSETIHEKFLALQQLRNAAIKKATE